MNDDDIIQLGGKRFRKIAVSTVAHDAWVIRQTRLAGFDSMTKGKDETADRFARRLIEHAMASENVFALLGGFLIPEELGDLEWKPAVALEAGEFIGGLHEPEDRLLVQNLVLSVMIPFLQSELAYLTTFAASSSAPGDERTLAMSRLAGRAGTSFIPGEASSAP